MAVAKITLNCQYTGCLALPEYLMMAAYLYKGTQWQRTGRNQRCHLVVDVVNSVGTQGVSAFHCWLVLPARQKLNIYINLTSCWSSFKCLDFHQFFSCSCDLSTLLKPRQQWYSTLSVLSKTQIKPRPISTSSPSPSLQKRNTQTLHLNTITLSQTIKWLFKKLDTN